MRDEILETIRRSLIPGFECFTYIFHNKVPIVTVTLLEPNIECLNCYSEPICTPFSNSTWLSSLFMEVRRSSYEVIVWTSTFTSNFLLSSHPTHLDLIRRHPLHYEMVLQLNVILSFYPTHNNLNLNFRSHLHHRNGLPFNVSCHQPTTSAHCHVNLDCCLPNHQNVLHKFRTIFKKKMGKDASWKESYGSSKRRSCVSPKNPKPKIAPPHIPFYNVKLCSELSHRPHLPFYKVNSCLEWSHHPTFYLVCLLHHLSNRK